MIAAIQYYTYLLLIFLLPTQFGKHFWPSFSFIGGFRVDYLSPTLYVTDILIGILFFCFIYQQKYTKTHAPLPMLTSQKVLLLFALVFLALVGNVLGAKNQSLALYGVLKLGELVFFGWYTAVSLGKTISYRSIGLVFAVSIVLESSLAIAQFFLKGSLGGIFYFFGERTFSSITPGIATAVISGQMLLRPYATLPHPNVLAGFLLISMIIIASVWNWYTQKEKIVVSLALFLGSVAVFLSLSRTTILVYMVLLLTFFLLSVKKRKQILLIGISVFLVVAVLIGSVVIKRFVNTSFLEESFLVRLDLLHNAVWMIQTKPFFGVGLMHFLPMLPPYQQTHSFYLHLQPVHNIFALLLAELGSIGFSILLYGMFVTVRQVYYASSSSLRTACFFLLGSILFLGMFDHYFVTLQQGQLLTAFVIGCCWSLQSGTHKGTRVKK